MTNTLSDEEKFCLQGCGTYKQYYIMRKRFESTCTFCEIDPEVNKVLYETTNWRVWENAFLKGRGIETGVLIASKKHWRLLEEITPDAWAELYDVMQWVSKTYDLPGGMMFLRFGDMRLNAGTVPHLHWNIWVPNQEKEVRSPIFKLPEDTAANVRRAQNFAERFEAGEVPQ